jgi:PKD repeat protein
MDARHGRIIMLGLLVVALMISATSAFAVIVHDAEVQIGSTVEVPVEIDQVPNNLWYFKITLTEADPATGELVSVTFPGWTTLTDNSTLPSDTLWMKGGNLMAPVAAGTENVSLGSFKIRGDLVGTSKITLAVNTLTTDDGFDFPTSPSIVSGNLNVLQLSGSIHVTSDPTGAEIWIDGVDTGFVTETTISDLAVGDHTVKVTLAGYQDAEQTVSVIADETVNADFVLVAVPPETGSIHVTSDPTGAEIWIDGVDTGHTTEATIDDVAVGDHTVKVTLAGYEDAEQTVSVIADETVNADFVLVAVPPETGSIHVTSDPTGAEIWLDGVDTGLMTEATISDLAVGDHTVKVTLAGYQDAEQTVTVVTDETDDADFTLVKVINPPKAQFLAFPRQGTAPLSVLFVDTSRGSPTSREWDFGDGATSTDQFTVHTYDMPGMYTVKLTVTNGGGSDTSVREDFITVKGVNPPVAQFMAYPHRGNAPLTVLFLDTSRGSPTNREWDFGDGTRSTDLFVVHTYTSPGKYTVKLTVSNNGGSDTMVREDFITVTGGTPPKAQFAAYPTDGTAPLAVTFLDLSRGLPDSRQWDFGDGTTSTEVNPVHTYENPGKYTVTLTVANDAGTDAATKTNFVTVTEGKIKAKENQGAGPKANGSEKQSENNSQASGSNDRPKIKIT